jgi:uncharacterized membrane-anchored protein YitT (DUF2179 family)
VGCLVGLLLCGLGALVAFIYGWVKARPWNITNIMYAWTACIVLGIVLNIVFPPTFNFAPPPVR